ncbi:hypothetical protein [Acinetobacter towneri]|uniref:hypothetical protein n=1 Tax=Acinetobacter towneri TaxID=202956 RepID=UPI0029344315|nr:hypothetical protein [Acinetobacter towneri]WOE29427.1 hypothetical protein QSG83_04315 [Acinetobacter towneri]
MKIFSQSIAVVAVSMLIAAMFMTACANHAVTSTIPTAQVEMYTSLQHRQCEPDSGLTLTEIVQRLQQAQIQVKRASVGSDGRMYAQVCGGADGKIAIVTIPQSQQKQAAALGFQPYSQIR